MPWFLYRQNKVNNEYVGPGPRFIAVASNSEEQAKEKHYQASLNRVEDNSLVEDFDHSERWSEVVENFVSLEALTDAVASELRTEEVAELASLRLLIVD